MTTEAGTYPQNLEALAKANRYRSRAKTYKGWIAEAGSSWESRRRVSEILRNPPLDATINILDLLRSVPHWGRSTANQICFRAGLTGEEAIAASSRKAVGHSRFAPASPRVLTERQREMMARRVVAPSSLRYVPDAELPVEGEDPHESSLREYSYSCAGCGGLTLVRLPAGATEKEVEEKFRSCNRWMSRGPICYRCLRGNGPGSDEWS